MGEPGLLRPEVANVRGGRRDLERNAVGHPEPVRFELLDFCRVVRHESHGLYAEDPQHAGGALVGSEVRWESEDPVGVDRVEAMVLKVVGSDLVGDPDHASFMREVEQDAAMRIADFLKRRIALASGIATIENEDVTSDTIRMQTE